MFFSVLISKLMMIFLITLHLQNFYRKQNYIWISTWLMVTITFLIIFPKLNILFAFIEYYSFHFSIIYFLIFNFYLLKEIFL